MKTRFPCNGCYVSHTSNILGSEYLEDVTVIVNTKLVFIKRVRFGICVYCNPF